MLTYLASSIWQSPAQTIVNTVNTVGAMGKGIALQFKKQYPEMYQRYRELCNKKELIVGKLWLYRADDRWIINFPTKKHWRYPSKPEYVESGLSKFVDVYEQFGITSISFPQLGTGHGGLDWDLVVKPMMEHYLKPLPIPVYIHLRGNQKQFVPEYLRSVNEAIPFAVLLDDVRSLSGTWLETLVRKRRFYFSGIDEEYLVFKVGSAQREKKVPLEHLRMLWSDLSFSKVLRSNRVPGEIAQQYGYIFALLNRIPYVATVDASDSPDSLSSNPAKALMLASEDVLDRQAEAQAELPL
ncbi:MAG: macro domain-containing protein [Desulfovibrionaceae bacterium]|nr:macro domain-containing protein [Desulfovibrionaceae bacterium]